ncbi:HAMP domain-containing sensor histidine kinase [[Ruminococcus] gnavus]|uniref:sensor histidine kinase n=1 Tax=Mediterraneibacter TaxID=2316020 RepID=UPI0006C2F74B|nr:HAMP domain-containing sensor histidine kinase [Mediterraneibacter gnavus]MBS6998247.1 HAMP domain-containing histidine kinase [Lachnospiraceae bacterium]RJW16906.1 sensor histidine kinase [Lachnospiraceae bacterium TM07-2AC]SCJ18182.1 Sensor histidine kinase graS [uncultured Ruminococcus sp.]HBJ45677.1 sensor histidine kinase [Ruminococcus sp.]MCZ0630494.1 HAMP domain-containing sensor histidine kinase [Mediterraneibacter gnavus]
MEYIRRIWSEIKEEKIWFVILMCTELVSLFFLWLSGIEQFKVLAGLETSCFVIIFLYAVIWNVRKEQKKKERFLTFLADPSEENERLAIGGAGNEEQEILREIGVYLRKAYRQADAGRIQEEEYERYVELWAHEVKIPLSLFTLLLENRSEEMSPTVYKKMEHVRLQMQSYVEQMLYYARVKAVNKEYLFEEISLEECCREVLDEYRLYLEEKQILVQLDLKEKTVLSDRKSLCFMLSQLIANSIKYTGYEAEKCPKLKISSGSENNRVCLSVCDNGCGVKPYELRYLFEKGFTGENSQKKSTGMGLYLVRQIGQELKIEVEAVSVYGKGMEIRLWFPVV